MVLIKQLQLDQMQDIVRYIEMTYVTIPTQSPPSHSGQALKFCLQTNRPTIDILSAHFDLNICLQSAHVNKIQIASPTLHTSQYPQTNTLIPNQNVGKL